jgi:hypothetical protein
MNQDDIDLRQHFLLMFEGDQPMGKKKVSFII